MKSIHDFPVEIMEHILWLGCELRPYWYSQSPWSYDHIDFNHNLPISRRVIHPFATLVATVCSSWRELTKEKDYAYFTFLTLDQHYNDWHTAGDTYNSVILKLSRFLRGLEKSQRSNIFVHIRYECYGRDEANGFVIRLFMHAMRFLLEYESQLREIKVNFSAPELLAYFALLLPHLRSPRFLSWVLRCPGEAWPVLSTYCSSGLQIDDTLGCASQQLPSRREWDTFRLRISGIPGQSSTVKAMTSLRIEGRRIDISALKTILDQCCNISRLGFLDVSVIEPFSGTSTIGSAVAKQATNFYSIRSISIHKANLSTLVVIFNQLSLPNLSTVDVEYWAEKEEVVKLKLPRTVSIVTLSNTFPWSFLPYQINIFDGYPLTPLEVSLIDSHKARLSWELGSLPPSGGKVDHRWQMEFLCERSELSTFSKLYKRELRETLGSTRIDWLKHVDACVDWLKQLDASTKTLL